MASPWLAVTVSVPPSVAPPGLFASATVTVLRGTRHHVAVVILDRGLEAEAGSRGDAARRLLRDPDLRGGEGRHGDGARDGLAEPAAGDQRGCSPRRPWSASARRRWPRPWLAVTVSVPPSVAPPGLFASATVTVPLKEVSMLPELSSASTVRPKGVPAARLAGGCCVTTSCPVTGASPRSRNVSNPVEADE